MAAPKPLRRAYSLSVNPHFVLCMATAFYPLVAMDCN